MKIWSRHTVPGVLLAMLAGCAVTGPDNILAISASNTSVTKPAAQQAGNAVTLRILPYVDKRDIRNPRLLGQVNTRVFGMHGNELLMDQDAANYATAAIAKRFTAAGFQVLEEGSPDQALFEVSGVVDRLTLNVKELDDINIAIQTNLKEVATGKVLWSAQVVEKNVRSAGVGGDNKDDLIAYLNSGLRTVSTKTVEAINTLLMASHPQLFNLTPGTKTIAGVTVYSAPIEVTKPSVSVPLTLPVSSAQAAGPAGSLSVTTKPQRAKVYLDDVYFGLSPLRSAVEPGVHSIVVKLKGYKAASEKVSVRKGETTELELNLER